MKPSVQRWVKGLIASFVQGGAGAVVSSVVTTAIDPDKFNPLHQLAHFLALAFSVFLVSGCIHLFMFLQQHPVPDDNTTIITKP